MAMVVQPFLGVGNSIDIQLTFSHPKIQNLDFGKSEAWKVQELHSQDDDCTMKGNTWRKGGSVKILL